MKQIFDRVVVAFALIGLGWVLRGLHDGCGAFSSIGPC